MCCREGTLKEDGGIWAGTPKPARRGHTGSCSLSTPMLLVCVEG
jgi:hypothetical protein